MARSSASTNTKFGFLEDDGAMDGFVREPFAGNPRVLVASRVTPRFALFARADQPCANIPELTMSKAHILTRFWRCDICFVAIRFV
jgi:hypothetical protein